MTVESLTNPPHEVVVVGTGPTKGKYRIAADHPAWEAPSLKEQTEETEDQIRARQTRDVGSFRAGENVYIETPELGVRVADGENRKAPMPWTVTAETPDSDIALFPGAGG